MAGLRVCFELSILNVLLATAPETDIIEATDESETEHFILIKLLIQSDDLVTQSFTMSQGILDLTKHKYRDHLSCC